MSAGELGEQPAGGGEGDVVAAAAGLVGQGDGEVGLADPDGPVDQDRPRPAAMNSSRARSRIWATGSLGLKLKSKLSRVASQRQVGGPEPAGDLGGVAAGQLVLAEDLEELDVAEGAGSGLGQAGVEGVEHPGQAAAGVAPGPAGLGGGRRSSAAPRSRTRPGRAARPGVSTPGSGGWTAALSVPAARMPFTVR